MEKIETKVGVVEIEYKVRWKSLTPKFCVYCTGSEDFQYLQFKDFFIIPEIRMGYQAETTEGGLMITPLSILTSQQAIIPYQPYIWEEGKPIIEEVEEKIVEKCRENKATVIRVKEPNHIDPVAEAYNDLYMAQLRELHKKVEDLFREFSKENPDLGFPNVKFD